MKKETYERSELEIIEFRTEDILTGSTDDEYELEKGNIQFPLV